jgi:hypothetical protein
MTDPRSVLREYRSLELKRRTQGLSGEEEARFMQLRDIVEPAPAPAPKPGFNVGAAAAELRASLAPAGVRRAASSAPMDPPSTLASGRPLAALAPSPAPSSPGLWDGPHDPVQPSRSPPDPLGRYDAQYAPPGSAEPSPSSGQPSEPNDDFLSSFDPGQGAEGFDPGAQLEGTPLAEGAPMTGEGFDGADFGPATGETAGAGSHSAEWQLSGWGSPQPGGLGEEQAEESVSLVSEDEVVTSGEFELISEGSFAELPAPSAPGAEGLALGDELESEPLELEPHEEGTAGAGFGHPTWMSQFSEGEQHTGDLQAGALDLVGAEPGAGAAAPEWSGTEAQAQSWSAQPGTEPVPHDAAWYDPAALQPTDPQQDWSAPQAQDWSAQPGAEPLPPVSPDAAWGDPAAPQPTDPLQDWSTPQAQDWSAQPGAEPVPPISPDAAWGDPAAPQPTDPLQDWSAPQAQDWSAQPGAEPVPPVSPDAAWGDPAAPQLTDPLQDWTTPQAQDWAAPAGEELTLATDSAGQEGVPAAALDTDWYGAADSAEQLAAAAASAHDAWPAPIPLDAPIPGSDWSDTPGDSLPPEPALAAEASGIPAVALDPTWSAEPELDRAPATEAGAEQLPDWTSAPIDLTPPSQPSAPSPLPLGEPADAATVEQDWLGLPPEEEMALTGAADPVPQFSALQAEPPPPMDVTNLPVPEPERVSAPPAPEAEPSVDIEEDWFDDGSDRSAPAQTKASVAPAPSSGLPTGAWLAPDIEDPAAPGPALVDAPFEAPAGEPTPSDLLASSSSLPATVLPLTAAMEWAPADLSAAEGPAPLEEQPEAGSALIDPLSVAQPESIAEPPQSAPEAEAPEQTDEWGLQNAARELALEGGHHDAAPPPPAPAASAAPAAKLSPLAPSIELPPIEPPPPEPVLELPNRPLSAVPQNIPIAGLIGKSAFSGPDDLPTVDAEEMLVEERIPAESFGIDPVADHGGPSPTFVTGSHRVVVHTLEGQVKRGTVEDVELDAPEIPITVQPGSPVEAIPVATIKAIFFMLPPGEKPAASAGKRVRVTFGDGRQLAGFSEEYRPELVGFYMTPADSRTSTARIWVYKTAVQNIALS